MVRDLQLIPATGWFAVLSQPEEPLYFLAPLVAWSLRAEWSEREELNGTPAEKADRLVVGLIGYDSVECAEDSTNFVCYYNAIEGDAFLRDAAKLKMESDVRHARCAKKG